MWNRKKAHAREVVRYRSSYHTPGTDLKGETAGEICAYRVLCTQTPRGTQFLTAAPDDVFWIDVGSIQT